MRRALAASIAWALISAGLWVGISYSPTYSARAISNDWDFEFKSFKPGEVVTVADRVREVSIVRSTKGEFTRILLGEPSIVDVEVWLRGDQRTSYPEGSWATIPLHVRTYYYNDIPFVWSDEAIAPYSMLLSIAGVFTAVSTVAGFPLYVDEGDVRGSSLVVCLNDGLPLDAFQVTINQGAVPYVGESAFLTMEPLEGNLDQMNSLHEGASDNGTFSFSDENANGLLDWGDKFSFNLPPTDDEYHIDSYVLSIFGPMVGIGYILMQKESPLFFHLLQTQEYSYPFYFLGMPPDQVSNGTCTSQVRIERRLGWDEYTSNSSLRLYIPGIDMPLLASANATHLNIGHGVSVHYNDTNKIGILDEGDSWLLENLTDSTFYELEIRSGDMRESGSITWVCGLGYNIAHRPKVALGSPVPDPFDTTLFRIAVDSVSWYITGSNASYYVLLRKNGTTLLPERDMWPYLRLDQLPLDPSSDGEGTVLSFNDTDGNGYFGAGDEFMVNSTASGSRYELVLFFPGHREPLAVVTWDT